MRTSPHRKNTGATCAITNRKQTVSGSLGAWKTMKKMIVCLAASLSLIWAGGMSSKVTLFQPSTLNGVALKPGEYKRSTSIRYRNGDGKMRITGIRIGGTNTKLVVN